MKSDATLHDWAVRVPATSANLGPGFDVLGLALDVHLVVGSRARTAGDDPELCVVTLGVGAGELATGVDNLLWQSFVTGCDTFDIDVPDVVLTAANEIPLERGMGSSSSAIVGGLALARAVAGADMGDRELVTVADEIEGHPDNVAPAILGGMAAATRADDGGLAIRRAQPPAGARVLLHVPTSRQLTSSARAALPDTLTRAEVITQVGRTAFMTGALTGAWPADAGVVGDVLHEPSRRDGLPTSDAILDQLRSRGVVSWLSGSGPTIASLVDADATIAALGIEGSDRQILLVDVDLGGVIVCPRGGCTWALDGDCGHCPHRALGAR